MTTIEDRIQEAAAQNASLLQTLRETDHAAPELENQIRYIAQLEQQVKESAQAITKLDRQRQKELKEHEKYRDSVMRRFAYKATGRREKFAQRAEKEEREYFEALQESHRESETRRNLEQMLRDAQVVRTELEAASQRHRRAQEELDGLYTSIFQGPTPEFPEEDRREEAAAQAARAYAEARRRFEAEGHALCLLLEAQKRMQAASASMKSAISASHLDMFGGGSMADAMERSELHKAEMAVRDARMMAMQAHMQIPAVNLAMIPDVNIAQGSIISDVFFDNIFTDLAFHDKIKASQLEVDQCAKAYDRLLEESKRRHGALSQEVEHASALLQIERAALQEARADVFRRIGVAGGERQTSKN